MYRQMLQIAALKTLIYIKTQMLMLMLINNEV